MQNANTEDRRGRKRYSHGLVISGLVLLGWQIAAFALALLSQVDLWLINLDPAWLAAFAGAMLSPPAWVMPLAVTLGFGMLLLGLSGGDEG